MNTAATVNATRGAQAGREEILAGVCSSASRTTAGVSLAGGVTGDDAGGVTANSSNNEGGEGGSSSYTGSAGVAFCSGTVFSGDEPVRDAPGSGGNHEGGAITSGELRIATMNIHTTAERMDVLHSTPLLPSRCGLDSLVSRKNRKVYNTLY
jgi:hypothetical protein